MKAAPAGEPPARRPAPTLADAPRVVEESLRGAGSPLRRSVARSLAGMAGPPSAPGSGPASEAEADHRAHAATGPAPAAGPSHTPATGAAAPHPWGDVRIHDDAQAHRAATAVGASAFTVGPHIVFGAGRYEPHTGAGRRLLVHELTHVVQQRGRSTDHRAPLARAPDPDPKAQGPGTLVDDLADALRAQFENRYVPPKVVGTIEVAAPSLTPGRPARPVQLALDVPLTVQSPVTVYAVPDEELFDTPEAAALPAGEDRKDQSLLGRPAPPQPAGAPAPTAAPTTAPAAAPVGSPTPASPAAAQGAGRYHTRHGPVDIVLRSGGYGITGSFTKLAVGAASLTVVETPRGVMVVDAGAAGRANAGGPLADGAMLRTHALVKGRPIVDVLVTHAHLDHTNQLARLAAQFEVLSLHISLAQAFDPNLKWDSLRETIGRNQRELLLTRVREQVEAGRAQWNAENVIPDTAAREQRWRDHVNEEVAARLAARAPLTVELQVPGAGGRMHVVSAPLEHLRLTDVEFAKGASTGVIRTPDAAAIVNRDVAEAVERGRSGKKFDVDRYATSYVLSVDGRLLALVLPDLRVNDLKAVSEQLKAEMTRLGRTAELRVWDVSHHLQAGFLGQRPKDKTLATFRASQLTKLTGLLKELADVRTATGGTPTDVVAVSARLSAVDPALAFVFTSMGFHIVPAASGQDVRLISAITAGNRPVVGLAGGTRWAGVAAADPLLRQAHAAREQLIAEAADLESRARKLRKAADRATREDLRSRAAQARERIARIDLTSEAYIRAVDAELGPRAKRSGTSGTRQPAPAQADALRAELTGFDRVVVGRLGSFSDVAVVLLGGDIPASSRADLQSLAEVRSIEAELAGKAAADIPPELRARYAAALEAKRNVVRRHLALANRAGPDAAQERTVLRDELKVLDTEVATALRATQSGSGTTFKQRLPSGKLVETRIEVPPQPGRFARGVTAGAQFVGQGLGAVMVYQLVRGEAELEERYQRGELNAAEGLISTAHNVYGMTVGVRMMGAIHVAPGEFVVLAALDIAQTWARDYDTAAQRNTAIAYSVIRNALSLGLMAAGTALMRTGPWGILVGMALMFLVDPILEAFGVYEWLERRYDFMPDDVVAVTQQLRKLIEDYRVVVGALELAERDDVQLASVGAKDAGATRTAARSVAEEHRRQAADKEAAILTAFVKGYATARTSYGGLPQLDRQRAEFLALMMRVHGAAAPRTKSAAELGDDALAVVLEGELGIRAGKQLTSREKADAIFWSVEKTLSLDSMTPDAIAGMAQWSKMDSWMDDITEQVADKAPADVDWKEVAEKMGQLDQMFSNARYRLNPGTGPGSERVSPLLTPTSPAGAVYRRLLDAREARFVQLNATVAGAPAGTAAMPGDAASLAAASSGAAQTAISAFSAALAAQPPLPAGLTAESIASHSADTLIGYPTFVRTNDAFRSGLFRMKTLEVAMGIALAQASAALARATAGPGAVADDAAGRLAQLREQARQAVEERREVKGFLYLDEVDERAQVIRAKENVDIARVLGQRTGVSPLTPQEQVAAATGELASHRLTTLTNRLAQVEALRLPSDEEIAQGRTTVGGIYQVVGTYDATDLFILSVGGTRVSRADNVLVGWVRDRGETTSGAYGHTSRVEVVPLNAAAVDLFGGIENQVVLRNLLEPATVEDLRKGL